MVQIVNVTNFALKYNNITLIIKQNNYLFNGLNMNTLC